MFSQAALSVTTYIRTIKVNVHGEGNLVSVGLITVGSMIYQFSDKTMILLCLSLKFRPLIKVNIQGYSGSSKCRLDNY